MRKYLVSSFIGIVFFAITPLLFNQMVQAGSLRFDSSTRNVTVGQTFETQVFVDAGTDQVTSTDIWVLFDSTYLEATAGAVTSMGFFPTVTSNVSTGKIYIAALIDGSTPYKTGSGSVAKIAFRALGNATVTLSFDCRLDVSNSSKIIKNDLNASNVIVCTQNGTQVITIGTGSSSSSTATPTPYSGSTTNYSNTSSSNVQTLPQTGFLDNLLKYATPGVILVLIGTMLRFIS